MKNDLDDTQKSLIEDNKFLADMDKNCKEKKAEWDDIVKTRGDELVAISETIQLLNSDDALELFKKTLPGTGSSFVQVHKANAANRARALIFIRQAAQKYASRR